VDPRAEVQFAAGDDLDGRAYRARLGLGDRLSEPLELDYQDVARGKGTLAWCSDLATRVEGLVRQLGAADVTGAGAR
jgi:hypothetical protein